MAFTSILSNIGKGLEKVFKVGTQVAVDAEPFVDLVFPGIGPLFNTVVSEVVKAEGLAIAAHAQNGTGPQKLASVVSAVEAEFNSFAKTNNLPAPTTAQIQTAVTGIVAFLNALPAASTANGAEPATQELASSISAH